MNEQNKKKIVNELIETFLNAGKLTLKLREKGLKETIKEDNTPVTNADIEVNKIISEKIKVLTPDLPIVSEETSSNKEKKNLKNFWLIDPIDGTYDYLNNKDEFTLNAALILNCKPEIGIINAPGKERLFYSFGINKSYEYKNGKTLNLTAQNNVKRNCFQAVSYNEKLKPEILKIHQFYKIKNFVKMKSSLKFCVIAAGEYDLYVAEPRACEWDIAAGHAILIHAGGDVTDFNGNEIFYGKENFKNPAIILKGKNLLNVGTN